MRIAVALGLAGDGTRVMFNTSGISLIRICTAVCCKRSSHILIPCVCETIFILGTETGGGTNVARGGGGG